MKAIKLETSLISTADIKVNVSKKGAHRQGDIQFHVTSSIKVEVVLKNAVRKMK